MNQKECNIEEENNTCKNIVRSNKFSFFNKTDQQVSITDHAILQAAENSSKEYLSPKIMNNNYKERGPPTKRIIEEYLEKPMVYLSFDKVKDNGKNDVVVCYFLKKLSNILYDNNKKNQLYIKLIEDKIIDFYNVIISLNARSINKFEDKYEMRVLIKYCIV